MIILNKHVNNSKLSDVGILVDTGGYFYIIQQLSETLWVETMHKFDLKVRQIDRPKNRSPIRSFICFLLAFHSADMSVKLMNEMTCKGRTVGREFRQGTVFTVMQWKSKHLKSPFCLSHSLSFLERGEP